MASNITGPPPALAERPPKRQRAISPVPIDIVNSPTGMRRDPGEYVSPGANTCDLTPTPTPTPTPSPNSLAGMRRDSGVSISPGANACDPTPSPNSPPVEIRPKSKPKREIVLDNSRNQLRVYAPPTPCSPKKLPRDFIRQYDPANPEESLAGKRHRDQAELDQMKVDAVAVRSAGGSCLWCLRTKKKCDTENPCGACAIHKRECFRGLEAFVPATALWHPSFPSSHAQFTLERMNAEAFKFISEVFIGINISVRGAQPCTGIVARGQTSWNGSFSPFLDSMMRDFLDVIVQSLNPSLIQYQPRFAGNGLVSKATHLSKLFVAARWLAQARVLVMPNDTTLARPVVFFSLMHHLGAVFNLSTSLCHDLFDALRKTGASRVSTDLDPTWIALAMYSQVADGLQGLLRNPMVARILGPEFSMDRLCATLRGLLFSPWIPRLGLLTQEAKEEVMKKEIPNLQMGIAADLEIWQGMRYDQLAFVAPLNMVEFLLIDPHVPDRVPEPSTWAWPELVAYELRDRARNGLSSIEDPMTAAARELDEGLDQLEQLLFQDSPAPDLF